MVHGKQLKRESPGNVELCLPNIHQILALLNVTSQRSTMTIKLSNFTNKNPNHKIHYTTSFQINLLHFIAQKFDF